MNYVASFEIKVALHDLVEIVEDDFLLEEGI